MTSLVQVKVINQIWNLFVRRGVTGQTGGQVFDEWTNEFLPTNEEKLWRFVECENRFSSYGYTSILLGLIG